IVAGALPAGVALTSDTGALAGTASAAGTSAFTVRATDKGDSTNVVDRAMTITIATAPVQLAGGALAAGHVTVPYSAALSAGGGSGTFRWSVVAGALPSGLTLDTAGGAIGGTPMAAGVSTFTVSATDAGDAANSASASFSVAIGDTPLSIITTALPSGRERVAYSATLQASGGIGSILWSAV